MASVKALRPHPRLYLDPAQLDQTEDDSARVLLAWAADAVRREVMKYAKMPPLAYPRNVHNEHLIRAREMQTRVVTLLVRWRQTHRRRYRDAVMRHVGMMEDWEYWSWIAWQAGDASPDAQFDLSYGENSATLAIAYDWLGPTLTPAEKEMFLRVADRSFVSARKWFRSGTWWFGLPGNNWNTVCAGGLGMLAMAMWEDVPDAQALLKRVEQSIEPFIRGLDTTSGGWPEGIGYWNYGMRYAFMYLLSWEAATGRQHPLMKVRGLRQTLSFPLDFCPNGQACSFGDVNHFRPLPAHYAMARRLGCSQVQATIDAILPAPPGRSRDWWPSAAEWLVLHPDRPIEVTREPGSQSVIYLYKGLDWAILADRMPCPSLYTAVRGGTTQVNHGHLDLMSYHVVVGDERLIVNLSPDEYLDTTFSPRREELFEVRPSSKNTLLINGVGIASKSSLTSTRLVTMDQAVGVRLEATAAMGVSRSAPAATFCARVVLLLQNRALLIVDRVALPHCGRVESRFHTFADVAAQSRSILLRGERHRLRAAFACNVPAVLAAAHTAPTAPSAPSARVVRWCTVAQHVDIVLATLLTPGAGTCQLNVQAGGRRWIVQAATQGWRQAVAMTDRLMPIK